MSGESLKKRPDMWVLQDRVARLQAQIKEYTDYNMYYTTKCKLKQVAMDLQECIDTINEIVQDDFTESVSTDQIDDSIVIMPSESVSEPVSTSSSDLTELFNGQKDTSEPSSIVSYNYPYSSKFIVSQYDRRFNKCANSSFGVLQVNQLCKLMNRWYSNRFGLESKNPEFHYKAGRLHEWVDLILLSAGRAIHDETFLNYTSEFDKWIKQLGTADDELWPLPSIASGSRSSPLCDYYTKEAIVLERLIKPVLYNSAFYPRESDSVERIVREHNPYSEDELELANLMNSCPSLIVTGSFDLSHYQENA